MTNEVESVSSYTEADLLAAIAKWQLDADRIAMIAEDLPAGAIGGTCRRLYGDAGPQVENLIVEVASVDAIDSDLFDSAIRAAGVEL